MTGHAQVLFEQFGVQQGTIRRAMRNHGDLVIGDIPGVAQDPPASLGHDHHACRARQQAGEHPLLVLIGLLKHGVQGSHNRAVDGFEQQQQIFARGTAEDAELMLDAHHVGIGAGDPRGGRAIVLGMLLANLEADFLGKGVVRVRIDHGVDVDGQVGPRQGQGLTHIGGEGGDPAAPGGIVADQGDG